MNHPLDGAAAAMLRRVRAQLAAPGSQTRWAFARDAAGRPVAATSPLAMSRCVVGAVIVEAVPSPSPLEVAAGRALPPALRELERRPRAAQADAVRLRALTLLDEAAATVAPRLSPAAWLNNTAPHAATIAMLDRAIERAGGGS